MTIAIRSSSRVSQPRRSRTFFCSRLKKLYMAALSPAPPTRPIEQTMSWRLRVNEFLAAKLRAAVGVHDAAGYLPAADYCVVQGGGGQS